MFKITWSVFLLFIRHRVESDAKKKCAIQIYTKKLATNKKSTILRILYLKIFWGTKIAKLWGGFSGQLFGVGFELRKNF